MIIATLFIIAQTWKQLRYKWINELWYIHMMEYDSAI